MKVPYLGCFKGLTMNFAKNDSARVAKVDKALKLTTMILFTISFIISLTDEILVELYILESGTPITVKDHF